MLLGKNKRGIDQAAGLGIVVGIALLLLTFGTILAVVRHTATKFDENKQVWLCTILNEIKFGIRRSSDDVLTSGESICSTIDKHSDEKRFVPISKYKQSKEGAESEIRDMVKNCWDMWLKGSQRDTFHAYPFSVPCFTCYTFKIKEGIRGVTYTSISKSMEDPFYARDTSNACMPDGGGYWRLNKCNPDEDVKPTKKTPPGDNYKCCAKDIRNVCENKGGVCSEGPALEGYGLYDKWKCLGGKSCYVQKEGSLYSYTDYIRKFGDRGGEIFFKPPANTQSSDINYAPGEIYTISFFSPNMELCTSAGCILLIGGYGLVALGATAATGYGLVAVAPVAGGFALKAATTIGLNAIITGGSAAAVSYKLGIFGNLIKGAATFVGKSVGNEVPNFILVSTLKDAEELRCHRTYSD